ncbi:MAG: hypothetical protein ABIP90_06295 [Vicinamibacterales bacterium]
MHVQLSRRIRQSLLSASAVCCALLAGANGRLAAQGQTQDTGTIPIRVVNGHLVMLTDLVGLRYTNEMSLEISFEYPDALTLHPDQYGWLGLDPNDLGLGEQQLVHILVAGTPIKFSIPSKQVVPEPSEERVAFQNSMTKLHSAGLGERKLKGTIGIGLLKKYHVTLDIRDKQMILALPREAGFAPSTTADVVIAPFEYANDRIQVSLSYGDDHRALMAIGGTNYDTIIDSRVTKPLGKPGGDISPLWLADTGTSGKRIDLTRYLAPRPRAFGLATTPGADSPLVITGVNFLEQFRVELDWNNQSLTLTQKTTPVYPQQDFAFFDAESLGTAEALEAYLTKYPKERLSGEAASQLVKRLLEQPGATDADVLKSLQWAVTTAPAGRKTETCLQYVTLFSEAPDRTALAIAAGTEGLKYSREAFDARVVYALHHQLGRLYMKQIKWTDAWKHLLSAAFMAPDDLEIALDLARVYDKQDQTRRAYARYKKVSQAGGLPPEIGVEVKNAMDRLRPKMPKDDPLLRDERPAGKGGGGR